MSKADEARRLLDLLDSVQDKHRDAQQEMLEARHELDFAEWAFKEEKVRLGGLAQGKNAEQRDAWVQGQDSYQEWAQKVAQARNAFSAAYAAYKGYAATIEYVHAATALVKELS
jgi:hypothetical protein